MPSGRRRPASARPPPGTPSWAQLGLRPPRQRTRTPSRARPLRRMRGADRPPPHDSFGRAAALRGRWGKEPVGRRRRRHVPAAAHYSVSTRVDPRSARNLRARARIPRSRHRSSLDYRAASRRPTRRILDRRVFGETSLSGGTCRDRPAPGGAGLGTRRARPPCATRYQSTTSAERSAAQPSHVVAMCQRPPAVAG